LLSENIYYFVFSTKSVSFPRDTTVVAQSRKTVNHIRQLSVFFTEAILKARIFPVKL
jgi:hypothetical protein